LNPIRGWNFLKDLEPSWRVIAAINRLRELSQRSLLIKHMGMLYLCVAFDLVCFLFGEDYLLTLFPLGLEVG